jgi:signal transduction histidine kinase
VCVSLPGSWGLGAVIPFLVPTAVGAAIRWRGLYDTDRLLSRSLVYLLGSVLVLVVVVAALALSGAVAGRTGGPVAAVLVTAVLAVAFDPVRRRLQRRVDRAVYGRTGDPASAVSRLGERLSAMLPPDGVPEAIVDVISESLGVQDVAVLGGVDGGQRILAQRGELPSGSGVLEVPLIGSEGPVGRLVVGPRERNEELTGTDRRMLEELGRHAGPAVHAALLEAEVRRARTALIVAREEERRRLRRDLHDGLGSYLVGIRFGIAGVRRHVPETQAVQLDRIAEQAAAAAGEVRRILDDLQPGPLEHVGLLDALQELADQAGRTASLDVSIACPHVLPVLPPSLEVAAYQVTREAVTNVVRHSAARSCRLRVVAEDGRLLLEVLDDGMGIPPDARPGVGLGSMRARAEGLGGRLTIARAPGGGTLVRADLPLAGVR